MMDVKKLYEYFIVKIFKICNKSIMKVKKK